jgi:hypothetical protein
MQHLSSVKTMEGQNAIPVPIVNVDHADTSHWQEVALTFIDNTQAVVRLDPRTIERIENGDNDLMEEIRQNLNASQVHNDTGTVNIETTVPIPKPCGKGNVAAQSGVSTVKHWTTAEATFLLETRLGMEEAFNGQKGHKTLWLQIKKIMAEAGYIATVDQCVNKFKQLKRDWRACIDHNAKTGNSPKTCQFFDLFNRLYGCKPATRPAYTLASMGPAAGTSGATGGASFQDMGVSQNSDSTMQGLTEPNNETSPATPITPQSSKKRKRPNRTQRTTPTVEWLQSYEERQTELKKQHIEEVKKMHADKISLLKELVDAIKK